MSCHDIAAIWVAFFSRYQRYRCQQVVWDNLALMHRGPIEGVSVADASHPRARLLFRVTVKGEPATALPRRDAGWWVDTHIIDAGAAPA